MYLWDQIQYLKKSGKPYLQYALERCGLAVNDQGALRPAFTRYIESGRTVPLREAVAKGRENARNMAVDIMQLYRQYKDSRGKEWVAAEIGRRYLE